MDSRITLCAVVEVRQYFQTHHARLCPAPKLCIVFITRSAILNEDEAVPVPRCCAGSEMIGWRSHVDQCFVALRSLTEPYPLQATAQM